MMDVGTAALGLAAGITERAAELIADGWAQGKLYGYVKDGKARLDVPEKFCVLGALFLAAQEILGHVDGDAYSCRNDAVQLAQAMIVDEISQPAHAKLSQQSIPGWNDGMAKTSDEVVSVMTRAAKRLWDLSVCNEDIGARWEPSRWSEEETADTAARQFLSMALA